MNIEVLKLMLKELEFEVDIAMGGQFALQMIQERLEMVLEGSQEMYKIILLDYSMPGMDGPQVAIETRKLLKSAGVKTPYICCCSAYSEASYKQNALEVGMD